jgi:hypothetical protein
LKELTAPANLRIMMEHLEMALDLSSVDYTIGKKRKSSSKKRERRNQKASLSTKMWPKQPWKNVVLKYPD